VERIRIESERILASDGGVDAEPDGEFGARVEVDEGFEDFGVDAFGWFVGADVLTAEDAPDAADDAVEGFVAVGGGAEGDLLADGDPGDIGFVDVDADAEPGGVAEDEDGGGHLGGDALAGAFAFAEDEAVEGRENDGAGELGAGLGEAGFGGGEFGFGAADFFFAGGGADEVGTLGGGFEASLGDGEVAFGSFEFAAGDGAAVEEEAAAIAFGAGLFENGAGFAGEGSGFLSFLGAGAVAEAVEFCAAFGEGGGGELDAGGEVGVDEGGEDLAAPDGLALFDEDGGEAAVEFGADGDLFGDGFDASGGDDGEAGGKGRRRGRRRLSGSGIAAEEEEAEGGE